MNQVLRFPVEDAVDRLVAAEIVGPIAVIDNAQAIAALPDQAAFLLAGRLAETLVFGSKAAICLDVPIAPGDRRMETVPVWVEAPGSLSMQDYCSAIESGKRSQVLARKRKDALYVQLDQLEPVIFAAA
jgi:hypothetical protein